MSTDYGPALWLPAEGGDGPHWFAGHDAGRAWIILHGTAGGASAAGIAQWFRQAPSSTHYIIGQDGAVVQCVAEGDSAWGNGPIEAGCDPWWRQFANPNTVTLSIEHVKPSQDNSDPLTPAQQAASFALVDHLCARWAIPRRAADAAGGITGHRSLLPVQRANCPGPYPWDELFAYLERGDPMATTITLPPGWADDSATGTLLGPGVAARGGARFPVVRGFRQALLTQPGLFFALGEPIEAEHGADDVGADGVHGPGTRQVFTLGALGWTAREGVFRLWTGLLWQRSGER